MKDYKGSLAQSFGHVAKIKNLRKRSCLDTHNDADDRLYKKCCSTDNRNKVFFIIMLIFFFFLPLYLLVLSIYWRSNFVEETICVTDEEGN